MPQEEFSDLVRTVTLALINGKKVPPSDIRAVFAAILQGAPQLQVAAFLGVLAGRGENASNLRAARQAMLDNMVEVILPPQTRKQALDIVGTGGDGLHTLNISTTAAILTAACHVPVAKHGNRAISSQSGAFDVLEALGYPIPKPDEVATRVADNKFAFLFAPYFHPAMKNVVPIRNAIKVPTLFNLLGPLCNPCRTNFMVIGAVGEARRRMMAEAMKKEVSCALVMGNEETGADEILSYGHNRGFLVKDGRVSPFSFTAEDAGFRSSENIEQLQGADAAYNASRVRSLFNGDENSGCFYASVIMTAASALYVSGRVASLREGSFMAANTLANKRALNLLSCITNNE